MISEGGMEEFIIIIMQYINGIKKSITDNNNKIKF